MVPPGPASCFGAYGRNDGFVFQRWFQWVCNGADDIPLGMGDVAASMGQVYRSPCWCWPSAMSVHGASAGALTVRHFLLWSYQLPADLNGDEQRSCAHEQVHARKGHSYDVLYYELLAAASWWNPLWRLALSYLRTVHELQADAVASTLHPDYGRLLLSRALGIPVSSLVNSFRSPNLKTRIAMLNITTSRYAKLKYALSIPLLALAFVAVSPRAAFDLPLVQEPVYDLSKLGVQPEFPGGMAAMYEYLASTIQYPDGALKENVQGKVFVQFVVGSDGKVRDAEVRRGVRKDLDDEAVRAISTMPDWKPGQMNGKAVATRFTVPIDFKLKGRGRTDD